MIVFRGVFQVQILAVPREEFHWPSFQIAVLGRGCTLIIGEIGWGDMARKKSETGGKKVILAPDFKA